MDGGLGNSSLTMSYFHTGIRTIIGAESFHCPVRDGKEWDQLAMVIRLNRLAWAGREVLAMRCSIKLCNALELLPAGGIVEHNKFVEVD